MAHIDYRPDDPDLKKAIKRAAPNLGVKRVEEIVARRLQSKSIRIYDHEDPAQKAAQRRKRAAKTGAKRRTVRASRKANR